MPKINIDLTQEQTSLIVAKLQSEQPELLEGTDIEIVETKLKSDLSVLATAAKTEEAINNIDVTPEEVK